MIHRYGAYSDDASSFGDVLGLCFGPPCRTGPNVPPQYNMSRGFLPELRPFHGDNSGFAIGRFPESMLLLNGLTSIIGRSVIMYTADRKTKVVRSLIFFLLLLLLLLRHHYLYRHFHRPAHPAHPFLPPPPRFQLQAHV